MIGNMFRNTSSLISFRIEYSYVSHLTFLLSFPLTREWLYLLKTLWAFLTCTKDRNAWGQVNIARVIWIIKSESLEKAEKPIPFYAGTETYFRESI